MKRSGWASLALASCLVWGSGCCCSNWFDGCSSSHFGGGNRGMGAGYAAAPAPCECTNAHGSSVVAGGPNISGGHTISGAPIITSDGPMLAPGTYPGAYQNQPPRIIPVPQAYPTPYTP